MKWIDVKCLTSVPITLNLQVYSERENKKNKLSINSARVKDKKKAKGRWRGTERKKRIQASCCRCIYSNKWHNMSNKWFMKRRHFKQNWKIVIPTQNIIQQLSTSIYLRCKAVYMRIVPKCSQKIPHNAHEPFPTTEIAITKKNSPRPYPLNPLILSSKNN